VLSYTFLFLFPIPKYTYTDRHEKPAQLVCHPWAEPVVELTYSGNKHKYRFTFKPNYLNDAQLLK